MELTGCVPQPGIVTPPSLKLTVPVRLVPDPEGEPEVPIAAVNVTDWLVFDGLGNDVTVVVELNRSTSVVTIFVSKPLTFVPDRLP